VLGRFLKRSRINVELSEYQIQSAGVFRCTAAALEIK